MLCTKRGIVRGAGRQKERRVREEKTGREGAITSRSFSPSLFLIEREMGEKKKEKDGQKNKL